MPDASGHAVRIEHAEIWLSVDVFHEIRDGESAIVARERADRGRRVGKPFGGHDGHTRPWVAIQTAAANAAKLMLMVMRSRNISRLRLGWVGGFGGGGVLAKPRLVRGWRLEPAGHAHGDV